jgi:ribosome-associated protein
MDIRKLQRAIVDGLQDVKAQNIQVFNTEHLSPLFERVIVASGTSNRQTRSLASSVRDAVKKAGLDVLRMEGESNGEWIIVDCGAAVVHVMQPAIREYYHLEEIWGEKPVNLKATAVRGLVKAAEPEAPAKKVKVAPSRRSGSAAEAMKAGTKATKAAPAKRAAPAKAAAPAKRASPTKRAAPAKAAAPAKRASPVKRAAPAKAAAPAKRATPTKRSAPAKASAPAKRAAPAKRSAPSKAAAPAKRAVPARTAAPKKTASAKKPTR